MDNFMAARLMMAFSLGFHIIFAVVGMAMPLLMIVAEGRWLRTGDATYLDLAKRWSKGTAIMFAVGAVSGTALSFEMGLLWPKFMAFAGPMIALPFTLELVAFFIEAIFLGIYLYGWKKVPPKLHWFAGLMVLISGSMSGVFVVTANAWMNLPTGFDLVDGQPVNIRPWEAMWNPMALPQVVHMVLAAFVSVGFVVAAIHARALLKDRENPFHRRALGIALAVASAAALLQPVSGHFSGEAVAKHQPSKLAAMEAHWETERGAAMLIGGLPDVVTEETRYAIRIPGLLSFIAFRDPNAEVIGLKDIPKDERPPVVVTRFAFQAMIAMGFFMATVAAFSALAAWRRPAILTSTPFLRLLLFTGPMGLLALECGWITTEVGRQPWIARGLMRSAEAVTDFPHITAPFLAFVLLYGFLGLMTVLLLRWQVFQAPRAEAARAS